VPLFYDRDSAEIPHGWVAKMKASMTTLSPIFSTNRMVAEYAERFYIPTSKRYLRLTADRAARIRPLVAWRKRLHTHGSEVKVLQVDSQLDAEAFVGSKLKVTARVSLGGVLPGDVRVQIYFGKVNPDGEIVLGRATDMALQSSSAADPVYEGVIECAESGSCGFSVRVVPFHEDAVLPYEMQWMTWEQ
jgi:starch phosphorylase